MLNPTAPTFRAIDTLDSSRPPLPRSGSGSISIRSREPQWTMMTDKENMLRPESPAFVPSIKAGPYNPNIETFGSQRFPGGARKEYMAMEGAGGENLSRSMSPLSSLRARQPIPRSSSPLSPAATPEKPSRLAPRINPPDVKISNSDSNASLLACESIWSPRGSEPALRGASPTIISPSLSGYTAQYGTENTRYYYPSKGASSMSGSFLSTTTNATSKSTGGGNGGAGGDKGYLQPLSTSSETFRSLKPSNSYPGAISYEYDERTRMGGYSSERGMDGSRSMENSRVMGQRDMMNGGWVCSCGLHNPAYHGECAKCHTPQQLHLMIQAPPTSPTHQSYLPHSTNLIYHDTYPSTPNIKSQNAPSISPLAVLAKLANHVEELVNLGKDGVELKRVLVDGDVNVCLTMGMRGLVGREAINPWKCMGVEIPNQHIGKYGPKPPIGTIAGDWSCSCGRENWAKRSVCSRCFPGIEPEYKVVVFNYVSPVFQVISDQEQHAEIQRGTEWLAAEERRLRREQQHQQKQQHQQSAHGTSGAGPTIGRKYVADFKAIQRERSPHLDHQGYRSSAHGELSASRSAAYYTATGGYYDEPNQHMSSYGQEQGAHAHSHGQSFGAVMIPSHNYQRQSHGRTEHQDYSRDTSQYMPMQSDNFYPPAPLQDARKSYMQNDRAYYGGGGVPGIGVLASQVSGHSARPYLSSLQMTDSSPPEGRFELITSPDSISSFHFAPFSPDPSQRERSRTWKRQSMPSESPTTSFRHRFETQSTSMSGMEASHLNRQVVGKLSDEGILTGEPSPHSRARSSHSADVFAFRVPTDQPVQHSEVMQRRGSVDPIGQGRPTLTPTGTSLSAGDDRQSKSKDQFLSSSQDDFQASSDANTAVKARKEEGKSKDQGTDMHHPQAVVEGELAAAMASMLKGLDEEKQA